MKTWYFVASLLFIYLFALTGCGASPESKGKALAERLNETFEEYLVNHKNVEIDFVNGFDSSKFSNREDAFEKYNLLIGEVNEKFQDSRNEILSEYNKIEGELIQKGYKELNIFESAYENSLNSDLEMKAMIKLNEIDYPQSVVDKVMTIVPPKPNIDKIKNDLASETLTEGFDKDRCWFSENQRWNLSKYNINNFTIDEVLRDSEKEYVIIASMRLENDRNAFDAKVKISYILPKQDNWEMEYVMSSGLSIVRTHKYDDLVNYEIKDDGWGGVNALFITNKSNVELVVGVDYVANRKNYRTCVMVSPDKRAQVGGVFGGGDVSSYQIGFVERY